MNQGVNRVELLGHVGSDPELPVPAPECPCCTFWLVTAALWKDEANTQHEALEWHRVVVWGQRALECHQYVVQGDLLYVEGRLTTRAWTEAEQYSSVTEIVATRVLIVARHPDGWGQPQPSDVSEYVVRGQAHYRPPLIPDPLMSQELSVRE